MACTPQELITANGCFNNCLTGQMASVMEVMILCVIAGGVVPPPSDVTVIGGEGDDIIIGGEGGGMIEVEGS